MITPNDSDYDETSVRGLEWHKLTPEARAEIARKNRARLGLEHKSESPKAPDYRASVEALKKIRALEDAADVCAAELFLKQIAGRTDSNLGSLEKAEIVDSYGTFLVNRDRNVFHRYEMAAELKDGLSAEEVNQLYRECYNKAKELTKQ